MENAAKYLVSIMNVVDNLHRLRLEALRSFRQRTNSHLDMTVDAISENRNKINETKDWIAALEDRLLQLEDGGLKTSPASPPTCESIVSDDDVLEAINMFYTDQIGRKTDWPAWAINNMRVVLENLLMSHRMRKG